MQMYDQLEFDDAAKVRVIDGGYLTANPRIARTGIQIYGGKEVGRPEMDEVRVYRPEASVFAKDAVHSYTHLPVTLDHPKVLVDSSNWKEYSIGDTGDEVLRDGITVRVPMMVRDAAAVKLIKDGVRQLSVGYTCDLEWKDGVTDTGEKYDAIQSNIRANHLAVVPAARGGVTLRIGDDTTRHQSQGDQEMTTLQKYTIDGVSIEMTDVAHQVVNRALTTLQTTFDEFKKKVAKEEEEKEDSIKKKDAAFKTATDSIAAKDVEIVTLKTQLKQAQDASSPAALEAAAAVQNDTVAKAKSVLGDVYSATGKSIDAVRKDVVDAVLKEVAKDFTAADYATSFNTIIATSAKKSQTVDHARTAFAQPFSIADMATGGDKAKAEAYTAYDKEASEEWKNPPGLKQ